MARIQLLASEPIMAWWTKNSKNKYRQEQLREAAETGLLILEGKMVAIDADKMKIYAALETLIQSGLVVNDGSAPPFTALQQAAQLVEERKEVPPQPVEKKAPDLRRLGQARQSTFDA